MNTLQTILSIMNIAAGIAKPLVAGDHTAATAEAVGEALLQIATQAAAAYQQHAGKPIDLSVLLPIDPVA